MFKKTILLNTRETFKKRLGNSVRDVDELVWQQIAMNAERFQLSFRVRKHFCSTLRGSGVAGSW